MSEQVERAQGEIVMRLLNGAVLMQLLQVAHRLFVEGALATEPQVAATAGPPVPRAAAQGLAPSPTP